MAGVYDDSHEQTTLAASTRTARRAARLRHDRGTLRSSVILETTPEFHELAEVVRDELQPSGPIETVLVAGIVAATWRLRDRKDESPERFGDSEVSQAERSLRAGLRALVRLRSLRVSATTPTGSVRLFEEGRSDDSFCWRGRLAWDDAVSEDSPIVRGTWITVGQVISRIIDGWSWADVLRAHPELCEDDLRACLAFTVEDEEAR